MATLYVSYLGGVDYSVAKNPLGSATITTSGTTARAAGNATRSAAIAVVTSDAAHYVSVGPADSVTASAATGLYVGANQQREIALGLGEDVAAITV